MCVPKAFWNLAMCQLCCCVGCSVTAAACCALLMEAAAPLLRHPRTASRRVRGAHEDELLACSRELPPPHSWIQAAFALRFELVAWPAGTSPPSETPEQPRQRAPPRVAANAGGAAAGGACAPQAKSKT